MTWDNYDRLTPGEANVLAEYLKSTSNEEQPTTRADGLTVTPH